MTSLTLKVPKGEVERLRAELLGRGFFEINSPHTLWSLSNGQAYIHLYPSGTLLLQGKGTHELKEFILSLFAPNERILIGCDESGKGDVFGPLVLCCAVIKPEYYKKVLELNLRDCKKMKDEEVIKKAEIFQGFGGFKCIVVEPAPLNLIYEEIKNLNRILDRLYLDMLREIKGLYPTAEVFVDAYSKRSPFGKDVVFEHKGEENIAVAAASVLARAKFLKWIKDKKLPKGSSSESLSLAKRIYREDKERAKELLKTFFL
ncbi:MAG: ribonuclease HIII [Aquificaceae bacterium]